jgi:curved DNA-binding protein CbpA
VVLETHPDATPAQVKAAFREKMKECHPDRVDGLAAPIQQLAKEMAQRLTAAVDQYNATNTG